MQTGKIYILRLKSGCLYIGQTTDVQRRWAEHNAQTGAVITRRDPPVEKLYEFDTRLVDRKLVLYIEDMTTLMCMIYEGASKAIGGRYLTTDYRRAKAQWLETELQRIVEAYQHTMQLSDYINDCLKAIKSKLSP